ncbi:putative ABC transport system ATP-binding protein/phosphonate transport system ATP-binding protein [Leucobacter luti]|uniref:ABC transporter ATP-binding protein n=1 Tax=Leucobacter luti TaxID=340320 RepID=UPI0010D4DCA1|nr:ATP-binding cassette domain-containing protein [Leucobacter luti]MCW2286948.1 ABC-type lipoprotein export system ATPase subunit [Leucobacter luti]TCK41175.1 putative ABC transport system ATP-binding protein/phosphonate transport system ATP-binding protein [Leucobacter luti]
MPVLVEALTIGFGPLTIIESLTCRFETGVLTALTGPSGSGKTSLLEVLAGLAIPRRGVVTLNGSRIDSSQIAWVPQGANALGARTALDNVRIAPLSDGLSPEIATAIALERLEQVGLASQRSAIARTLSGGELQRLAFARAMASSRPLVLADEPTANLDTRSAREVTRLLQRLSTQRTMIVATHDQELVLAAAKVVNLRPSATESRVMHGAKTNSD